MNDISFKYVVLRNWDGLPYDVKCGPHSDLDLLVYDLNHFKEIFGDKIRPVYPLPRVQHKVLIGDTYILADLRHIGDSYYPYEFEKNILEKRVYNNLGFYTPDPIHHRIALAYHAIHHKGFIDKTYRRWLGDSKLEDILEALKSSNIGWDKPDDYTVGSFNSYTKGATSVVSSGDNSVKKKQYRFKNYNLISNESNILKKLNNKHFPKILSYKDDEIEIESCGEDLTLNNLPENWDDQLVDILRILRANKITHRDIRIENMMIKDGTIKLIDFGWAVYNGEMKDGYPDLLGYPNKAPWGFDDAFSMGKVMKQIRAGLESHENIRA